MGTRSYIAVAENGAGNWGISFPAFPGVTSVGDTLAEVIAHGRDALASAIEAMEDDGADIPVDYAVDPNGLRYDRSHYEDPHIVVMSVEVGTRALSIAVTMDEVLLSRLDTLAERTNETRSTLLAKGARLVLANAEF